MGNKDPRVDAYIGKAAPFAQPILRHLRALVHNGCPGVQETIKWSMPFFDYKGPFCNMAAFKQHCSFNFWKSKLFTKKLPDSSSGGMGDFGRMAALSDLPPDKVILGYIKEAMRINDEGLKISSSAKSKTPKEIVIPDYFTAALAKNKKAKKTFEEFSYSHKKEYVEWITDAKREETRQRRIATALEWLTEGKTQHWKYEKC